MAGAGGRREMGQLPIGEAAPALQPVGPEALPGPQDNPPLRRRRQARADESDAFFHLLLVGAAHLRLLFDPCHFKSRL